VETRFRKNFAPWADMVTAPLEMVCPLRFGRRWSVLKCSWWRSSSAASSERAAGGSPAITRPPKVLGVSTFMKD
jgi:hypothetical protein